MSDNMDLTTVDEELTPDLTKAPVVSGPSDGDVKEIDAVDDSHPLVQETGSEALETQTESGAGEFLSDFIYEEDSAWAREWQQNHETACYRAAKLLVRLSNEYDDDWLTITTLVDKSTGETITDASDVDVDEVRKIEIPRPMDEVFDAARTLGYEPAITWDYYRDEEEIITEDNGIGMTSREFDEAFNTIFNSGSGVDGESGGQFGVGSESQALVTGKEGGAEVETYSRRPGNHEGFRAYSYLGGANALPGEVDDDFRGTKFILPVCDSFNTSKLEEWVEHYSDKLRVPVLYQEHDAGSTPVKEEYEATDFVDDYDNPPVVIDRPGEFTVVAGPDVIETGYHADDEDTFLVSMPIDRNCRSSMNTLWNTVVRINDEQGRIVAGPNRGRYHREVDELHEDDVVLPEPTGSRDSFQRDSKSKKFWSYLEEEIEAKELENVDEVATRMDEMDHPADAIKGEDGAWTLFKSMISHYGPYNVMKSSRKIRNFIKDSEHFPAYDKETAKKVSYLFKKIEHCNRGPNSSSKKKYRTEKPVGDILTAADRDTVFMAASTGGNFTDRFKVAKKTHGNIDVIVVNSASKYDTWSSRFGFNVLKEVPVTQSEDHDFDVPDDIHERHINRGSKNTVPDDVKDRSLKIRTDDDNSSIDLRLTISDAQDRLEDGRTFNGHSKLVLFPGGQDYENISDHYDFSKYAAIASVSKKEYDELRHYKNVLTFEEYQEWSESALIATEDGAMTPSALIEDDRLVILAYRPGPSEKQVVKLLGDDMEDLRNHYVEDRRDQFKWCRELDGYDGSYRSDDVGNVDEADKPDTLFAVAGPTVLSRAEWAFRNMNYTEADMMGLKLTHKKFGFDNPAKWKKLSGSTTRYRLMVDTPNWDNDSSIYNLMPNNRDSDKAQMYLGFHDLGIDPSEHDAPELRKMINGN
jgi:hypothetical protein